MTCEPIPVGRELDAMVAEALGLPVVWAPEPYYPSRLPGRHPWLHGSANGVEYDWAPVPFYSTEIAATWSIIDHLTPLGHRFCLRQYENGAWVVTYDFANPATGEVRPEQCLGPGDVRECICRAALAVKEKTDNE